MRLAQFLSAVAVLTLLPFTTPRVEAGTITFSQVQVDLSGGGFGNILQILVLQQQGNNTTEYGSVTRVAGSDVTGVGDDTTNQAQTLSVAQLATKGIVSASTFGLIFNINEAVGSEVVLHDFTMTFTDDSGTSLFPDLTYSPPSGSITLDEVAGGQGGSGWLFRVLLTASEAATFFGDSTNRVGMFITSDNAIEDTSNGADGFHVFSIPEPATLWPVLLGMCAVARRARRQSRIG